MNPLLPVLSALLVGISWGTGAAQECPDSALPNSWELARKFAPILRFAPGERYFPTIPFFTAFDTIGGPDGFLDAHRVALTTKSGRISWNALDSAYLDTARVKESQPLVYVPKFSAVFYRVRCLVGKQNKQLWGFLKNDPQAWHRTGLDGRFKCGMRQVEFTLIEYYLYYVRDAGLEGHPHDIERVDVLLPRKYKRGVDPDYVRCPGLSPRAMLDSLRIVVGTGHSETTPNNILVLQGLSASELENPSILVELGGHASAPDRNRDSEFQLGLDVNWNNSERVWGTRDVQAVSGTGYLGRYSSEMTLPRPPGLSTTLRPDTVSANVMDSVALHQKNTQRYALLPVAHFQELSRYLQNSPTVSECDTAVLGSDAFESGLADSVRRIVDTLIKPQLGDMWPTNGLTQASDSQVVAATRRMALWLKSEEQFPESKFEPIGAKSKGHKVPAGKVQIWRHASFCRSPVDVLKRRLYRPTGTGIQNIGDVATLLTFGFAAYLGDGGQQFQLGMVVPVIKSKLVVPGVLEPQIGLYSSRAFEGGPRRVSVSLLYERYYHNTFSWYVKPINYVKGRAELDADPEAADYAFGFGISVMPFFPFPGLLFGTADQLRIRAGIRVDVRRWVPNPRRLELQSTFYLR
jgi:hypothetical protein